MTAFHPFFLFEVNLERNVADTGDQQVLYLQHRYVIGVGTDVDGDVISAVTVVDDLIRGRTRGRIVGAPLGRPPTVRDADLVGVEALVRLEGEVERLRHEFVPDLFREAGKRLVAAIVSLHGETVLAAPVDGTLAGGILVRPDSLLDRLPVAAVGRGLVGQGGHVELLLVHGEDLTGKGAFVDGLPGDGHFHFTGPLAVETGVADYQRVPVGVHQLDGRDELQVGTVDGEDFSTLDLCPLSLGIAGYDSVAQRKRCAGFGLVGGGANDDLAAFGSDAGGGFHADHLSAHVLEAGNAHGAREDNLGNIGKAVTVDGHRLSGYHLGGEEGLDAQSQVGRGGVLLLDTGREGTHQKEGQNDIFQ